MFLTDKSNIYCLECDYSIDSSSLPADLQYLSFELKSALWKIFYVACKTYRALYNNYDIYRATRCHPSNK